MKTLLILGAGTAGTMLANDLARRLDLDQWRILLVDKDENHYFQPGYLFIPFDIFKPKDLIRPKRAYFKPGIEFIHAEVEMIEPDKNQVRLSQEDLIIKYDQLVIATGIEIQPQEIKGLQGEDWRKNIFDFYTLEGAIALREYLRNWEGGQLLLNVAEVPIKCPIAPLEFLFLADWYFNQRGMRDKVALIYSSPLDGVVSKLSAAAPLQALLEKKGGRVELEFFLMQVDGQHQLIRSYDDRELEYDLLVSVPTNMGASMLKDSGLGNEFHFVQADDRTLQSRNWENVWAAGDVANTPAPKVGSAAHFMVDALADNLVRAARGKAPLPNYDGRTTCIIESGYNKGVVLSFDYDHEPMIGKYPYPLVGPLSTLRESSLNFVAKRSFLWFYWNLVLKYGYVPFA